MSVSNYTDIGITKSQITTKGGRLTVSGSANQGYATPNGSSGNAGLRALVAADLPTSGTWAFGGTLSGNITYTGNGNYLTATGFDILQNTTASALGSNQSSPLLEIAGTYFGAANQSLAVSATDLWSIQDVVTASPASLSGSTAITHISEASGNVVTLTLASQTTFNTAGVLVTLSGFPSGAGSWLNGYVVNLTTAASTSITFTDPSGHGTLSFTVLTGTPVITEVSGQSALTFTYAGSQPTGGTYATVAFPNAVAATSTTTNWSPTIETPC